MILLNSTSSVLRVITSAATTLDVHASWADIDGTTITPGSTDTLISTATTTTIVAAPAGSAKRSIRSITLRNRSSTLAQTITVAHFDGTNAPEMFKCVLAIGEQAHYDEGRGWTVFDSNGRMKTGYTSQIGVTGRAISYFKTGTAREAVGLGYCYSKDAGNPGAWAVGTPGLAGRATDGMAAPDAGCLPLWTPAGALYLQSYIVNSTITSMHGIRDVMWVNSGIVVTTTTAQTINSVALPARDYAGSINGLGVGAGLLATAATTNAGAITNTTISYTNQNGTAGRTGTLASWPATAVIGTTAQFRLAAGDTGIRSIQSITLGTSYGGGSISLYMFVDIAAAGILAANIGSQVLTPGLPGVRLYTGSCLLPFDVTASAVTASTVIGLLNVAEI